MFRTSHNKIKGASDSELKPHLIDDLFVDIYELAILTYFDLT